MSLQQTFQPRPAPVYVLLHEARPHRDGALALIDAAVRPSLGPAAFNHSVHPAAEHGEAALAAARTLPMMAERRLVVVRDVQDAPDGFFEALTTYLESPSPGTTLVLVGSGYPKVVKGGRRWSTVIERAVKQAGGWVLDRKASPDAVGFAVERAASYGKRLAPAAARGLVELVGSDLGQLEREVDKLSLYVGDADTIGPDDVASVCALVAEAVVWELTTALVRRDRRACLASATRLLEDGEDPRRLLFTMAWKLRGVLAAADALAAGADDASAARASKLRRDELGAVKRSLRDGEQMPHVVLQRLAQVNREMNSHRAGARRVLERLLVEWTA